MKPLPDSPAATLMDALTEGTVEDNSGHTTLRATCGIHRYKPPAASTDTSHLRHPTLQATCGNLRHPTLQATCDIDRHKPPAACNATSHLRYSLPQATCGIHKPPAASIATSHLRHPSPQATRGIQLNNCWYLTLTWPLHKRLHAEEHS